VREIAALVDLAGKEDALPAALSLAEQRRLEIGRAWVSAPHLLFLDEPSAGMNEPERADLAALIRRVRDDGTTVVIIDHNLDLTLSLADRAVVLDSGRAIATGTPQGVLADPGVRAAYLGLGSG
jgi:branched-chain amino acid transport system ATP-binding protein